MLVAIEGAALTGKSTLAWELAGAFPGSDIVSMHGLPAEFSSLMAYEDSICWYDPLGETTVILDGSYLSELVRPEIERRPTDMIDPAIRRHVEMFMCARGCVTVYATRDYAELHEAWFVAGGDLCRPASLALVLERYEAALSDAHSRGYQFEHDHAKRHLSPKDIAFVCGQADDDVRPFYGITHRWIGNPKPRWVVAASGYTDHEIPGRAGAGLHPTIAHLLRNIPESAWRGVALVDIDGITNEGLVEFSRLADAEAWVAIGDEARERVFDIVQPARAIAPGYAIKHNDDLALAWNLWSEM